MTIEKVTAYKCPGGHLERSLDRAKACHLEDLKTSSGSAPISFTAALHIVNRWEQVKKIVEPSLTGQAGRVNLLEKSFDLQAKRLQRAEELLCDVLTNRKGPEHDPFADIAKYLSEHRPDIYPPEKEVEPVAVKTKKLPPNADAEREDAVTRIATALDQTPFRAAVERIVRHIPIWRLAATVEKIEKDTKE